MFTDNAFTIEMRLIDGNSYFFSKTVLFSLTKNTVHPKMFALCLPCLFTYFTHIRQGHVTYWDFDTSESSLSKIGK